MAVFRAAIFFVVLGAAAASAAQATPGGPGGDASVRPEPSASNTRDVATPKNKNSPKKSSSTETALRAITRQVAAANNDLVNLEARTKDIEKLAQRAISDFADLFREEMNGSIEFSDLVQETKNIGELLDSALRTHDADEKARLTKLAQARIDSLLSKIKGVEKLVDWYSDMTTKLLMDEALHVENIEVVTSAIVASTALLATLFLFGMLVKAIEMAANTRDKNDMMDAIEDKHEEAMSTLREVIRRLPLEQAFHPEAGKTEMVDEKEAPRIMVDFRPSRL